MTSDEIKGRLIELLEGSGINRSQPSAGDVDRAWHAMRRLAMERVTDVSPGEYADLLLAQYGTYDWGDGEHFELDITRQLSFDDDHGEYSHMTQLSCTFHFRPDDELRALGANSLWSGAGSNDEFFEKALELPGFSSPAVKNSTPLRLVVEHEEV
jgi:hypothetical protein